VIGADATQKVMQERLLAGNRCWCDTKGDARAVADGQSVLV